MTSYDDSAPEHTAHEVTREPGLSLNRRHAVAGLGLVTVAAPILVACSGGNDASATDPQGQPGDQPSSDPTKAPGTPVSDIPVGGGVILSDQRVVLTQPEAGTIKAFSATCTHQGCLVTSVTSSINCPCHGSTFSITDGSVLGGPASSPLPPVEVKVVKGVVQL